MQNITTDLTTKRKRASFNPEEMISYSPPNLEADIRTDWQLEDELISDKIEGCLRIVKWSIIHIADCPVLISHLIKPIFFLI